MADGKQEIEYTEDGINYEIRTFEAPEIAHSFSDEGMIMLESSTQNILGSITWQEQQSGGGDTYIPANIQIQTSFDKEVQINFKETNVISEPIRFTYVNDQPQIIVGDSGGILTANKVENNEIEFFDSRGQPTGAGIVGSDGGSIVFYFMNNGEQVNLDIKGILEAVLK